MAVGQVALIVIAVVFTTAAADTSARFDKLGHRIMCSCGCNELLLECNHVGCPNSEGMRQELMAGVDRGDSDKAIFQAFSEKYGPTALAAPTWEGFNIVGWVMPFTVLILGIGGTVLLIRKWKLRSVPMPPPSTTPHFSDIRDRIRRETEI
jgi:cytochrome c-type biogenesis protein CcmH